MKIEFEIDKKDAHILISALEYAASKAPSRDSFESIQKIIQEIKDDLNNGVRVFNDLHEKLTPYTDNSPIKLSSNFRTQLGISEYFISSNRGLIAILNTILRTIVAHHKPGSTPNLIKKNEINNATTIKDLVTLILNNYESSH